MYRTSSRSIQLKLNRIIYSNIKLMHPTRIFKTPEDLLKAWGQYKQSLKEQAKEWPKIQYVGKDGNRVTDYPVIPFTLEGFKRYCVENHGDVSEYFLNRDEYHKDFTTICSRIREEIREQQIIGGMLGFYNPSITQRLNGLTEKTENTNDNKHSGSIKIEVLKSDTPLSNSEKDIKLD